MKNLRLFAGFIAFCIISTIVISQEKSELLKAKEILNAKPEVYISLYADDFNDVLNSYLSLDYFKNGKAYAYANAHAVSILEKLSVDFKIETSPGDIDFDPSMKSWEDILAKGNEKAWDFYPTYSAYVSMMYQFQTDYPDLVKIYKFGETVLGRDLLFAKITSNVNQPKAVPKFMYTSTMHGDETAGFVLLLRLIDYLTTNYASNDDIAYLLDNLEIWICPNENPDGTYTNDDNTVSGATRSNANGYDLNRNYPNPVNSPSNQQKETTAMINFTDTMSFVMSANMHGGIELVNYPYDSWTSTTRKHADHDWFYMVSREYADTAQYYSPAGYMTAYGGITHGGDWYVVYGSRQDYFVCFKHGREITLELSDTKLLPPAQLPAHWEYNYRSFLNYMRQSLYGIKGIVKDAVTLNPVVAKIEILSHDDEDSEVYSGELLGNFQRPLIAGTYSVRVSAFGYASQTFTNIVVENFATVILDVFLVPQITAEFSASARQIPVGSFVEFYDMSYGDVQSWNWSFPGAQPSSSTQQNPLNVKYPTAGTYNVSLEISDEADSDLLTKEAYIKVLADQSGGSFNMANGVVSACSGYFYDSGGNTGNYNNNQNFKMTFVPSVQGNIVQMNFELFNVEYESNCGYDVLKIYNGSSVDAPLIGTYCGTNSPGTVTADNVEGALTFWFVSDGSAVEAGWRAQISCIPSFRRVFVDMIGNGDFSISGTGMTGDNPYLFDYNAEVTLNAIPASNYYFEKWTENGIFISNNEELVFNISDNRSLTAHFLPDGTVPYTYILSVNVNPENAGEATGGGEYEEGEEVLLSATPYEGYVFENWTHNGNVISVLANFLYTMPAEDVMIIANFVTEPVLYTYILSVNVNPENAGEATGDGEYEEGEEVLLSATPYEGYVFENWTHNGNVIIVLASFLYTMPAEDVVIIANFILESEPETYILNLIVNPEGAGTVTGDGEYEEGDIVNVVATPNSGYLFLGWYLGEDLISNDESYDYTMPAQDINMTANFEIINQVINQADFNIELFPNPSYGKVSISSTTEIKYVSVFSINGQEVITHLINSNKGEINLDFVDSGVYFIKIVLESDVIVKKFQIIKAH